MGNELSAERSKWEKAYADIKNTHDEAYRTIDEAIKLEEEERQEDALKKYEEGILIIDKALSFQVTCPPNTDERWQRACEMVKKMKQTRAELLMRINSIQSSPEFRANRESPPSYDEAMSQSSSSSVHSVKTYNELAKALQEINVDKLEGPTELLYSQDNVRLYNISPDGSVCSSLDPDCLKIAVIDPENETPFIFMQVGEWVYPLIPGASPCYRTKYGAFVLPDLNAPPGWAIGLTLPPEADCGALLELLEDILHGVVNDSPTLKPDVGRHRRSPAGVSHTISNGLLQGAYYISRGLVRGAEKAGELINHSTPKLFNYISPAPQTTHIPTPISQGLETAKQVSGTAAQVTGFVANKVGLATVALGRYLAPHIEKQGTRLLHSSFNIPEKEAKQKMSDTLTIAAGAVEGFVTVYSGLEESARILGSNLANNTVKIVEYKYGQPAGVATGDTLNTVGNIYNISHNINYIKPKGLVKIAAKETGKAVLSDYKPSEDETDTANTIMYPDLSKFDEEISGSSSKSRKIALDQQSNGTIHDMTDFDEIDQNVPSTSKTIEKK